MAFTLLTGICIYPIDHFSFIGCHSEDLAEVTKISAVVIVNIIQKSKCAKSLLTPLTTHLRHGAEA